MTWSPALSCWVVWISFSFFSISSICFCISALFFALVSSSARNSKVGWGSTSSKQYAVRNCLWSLWVYVLNLCVAITDQRMVYKWSHILKLRWYRSHSFIYPVNLKKKKRISIMCQAQLWAFRCQWCTIQNPWSCDTNIQFEGCRHTQINKKCSVKNKIGDMRMCDWVGG